MKQFLANLNARDRLILGIGGLVSVVYFFYLIIYAPLTRALETESKQWIEKNETLIWMRQQSQEVHSAKHTPSNLLSVFSTALKNTSFSQFPYQLQQADESHVRLSFVEVPYVDCLRWIRHLNEKYAMHITELSVARGQRPGMVRLHLLVEHLKKGNES